MEVPRVRTPLTFTDIKPLLKEAYHEVTGEKIGSAFPYLLSMIAIENARGRAIWNHNWGNVITTGDSDYFMQPNNERHFRDIPSHEEGARRFVKTLLSETNVRILEAAKRGDFNQFFAGIVTPHPQTKAAYCDDCVDAKESYESLVREFGGMVKSDSKSIGAKILGGVAVVVLSNILLRKVFK